MTMQRKYRKMTQKTESLFSFLFLIFFCCCSKEIYFSPRTIVILPYYNIHTTQVLVFFSILLSLLCWRSPSVNMYYNDIFPIKSGTILNFHTHKLSPSLTLPPLLPLLHRQFTSVQRYF